MRLPARALLLVGLVTGPSCAPRPAPAVEPCSTSAEVDRSGTFHVVWGAETSYYLVSDEGEGVRLSVPRPILDAFGGGEVLDRRAVRIRTGSACTPEEPLPVRALELAP
jgi:hypothetical protein